MKQYALLPTISLFSALLFSSCQSTKPAEPVLISDKHEGVELSINIKHFTGKKCQQKVSDHIYKQLSNEESQLFIIEPKYKKHHSLKLMKIGRCDNTVIKQKGTTNKYDYLCGGHSFTQR